MSKLQRFQVYFKTDLEVSMTIEATDLEDAIARGKEMKPTEIFSELGGDLEWNDGDIRLSGVYETR